MIGLLFENSKNIQIKPKATTIIVKIGEFSNQSPGRVDFSSWGFSSSNCTLKLSIVLTLSPFGADQYAIAIETITRIMVIAIDCQRKIVSVNGITPVKL
ncbi:hypothetical protein D9M71_576840 [compost metagenome]